jgi:hypothetical protein
MLRENIEKRNGRMSDVYIQVENIQAEAKSRIKALSNLKNQLADRLISLLNMVVDERQAYYQKHPDEVPDPTNLHKVITRYSNQNAIISGGLSLAPGPWGMAAVIPEIALVLRNQLMLIYDIGMAYGQSHVLTRELVMGVFAYALGMGGIGLLTVHGSKVLVRSSSVRALQRVVGLLGGRVSEQVLSALVARWIPGIGVAAMAAWSRYSTAQVGKKAMEILRKPIELTAEEIRTEEVIRASLSVDKKRELLKLHRAVALINLAKADGKLTQEEFVYLDTMIANAGFSDEIVADLRKKIAEEERDEIDFSLFVTSPGDALRLMLDLVALAKRDEQVHITEKMYIQHIGRLLGYSEADVVALIEA